MPPRQVSAIGRPNPEKSFTVSPMEAGTSHTPAGSTRHLLQLDPDLGALLEPDRRQVAEPALRVRTARFTVGEWDGQKLADADPLHLGLLIVEGVLAREVVLADTVST